MKFKRIYLYIFIFIIIILAFLGFIEINRINTNALSPIGNTQENYQKITSEFGEDFDRFIQDKANIKIYSEENGETLVKINELGIRIKNESPIINKLKEIILFISENLYNLVDNLTDYLSSLIM